MIRVQFSTSFDDAVWTRSRAEQSASVGRAFLGERGLIRLIAQQTGLARPDMPDLSVKRMLAYQNAAVTYAKNNPNCFFTRSLAKDRLNVASLLLNERDSLVKAGWNGLEVDGVPRTKDFAQLEAVVAALDGGECLKWGDFDLLQEMQIGFEAGKLKCPSLSEIEFVDDDMSTISPRWASIFTALKSQGVRIEPAKKSSSPAAKAKSDLFQISTSTLTETPLADGSVLYLKASNPWEAARLLASWYEQQSLATRHDTVIIAATAGRAALREAFQARGFGLAGESPRDSFSCPGIQILLLALQLIWAPKDAGAALALLTTNGSPVPRAVSYRLIRALGEARAVGGPEWTRQLEAGILELKSSKPEVSDDDYRKVIRARITEWFGSPSFETEKGAPLDEILKTCARVSDLLRIRAHTGDALNTDSSFNEGLSGVRRLTELVRASGLKTFSREELARLVTEAVLHGAAQSMHVAEANGPFVVAQPAALRARAKHVIWWDFSLSSVPKPKASSIWNSEDQARLRDARVLLPKPARLVKSEAQHWRNACLMASERLTLVTWEENLDDRQEHIHPAFSEWTSTKASAWSEGLKCDLSQAPSELLKKLYQEAGVKDVEAKVPPFKERVKWTVPAKSIAIERTESPSSLQTLLGCELAYAFRYGASIYGAAAQSTEVDNRVKGTIAHAALAIAFPVGRRPKIKEAVTAAKNNFHSLLEERAPVLLTPEKIIEKVRFEEQVLAAVRTYGDFLEANDLEVKSVEQELPEAKVAGLQMKGKPDSILKGKDGLRIVMDHKWSGLNYHRDDLINGVAIQPAVYAELELAGGNVAIGYHVIETGEIIVLNKDLKQAVRIDGPTVGETVKSAAVTVKERIQAINKGELIARGLEEGAEDAKWSAPCRFCDYTSICGLAWRKAE